MAHDFVDAGAQDGNGECALRIEPAKLQCALAKGLNAERRRERLFYVRRISKLDPQLRRTQAAAALIIAESRHTASEILKQFRCKLFLLPGNVIDPHALHVGCAEGHDITVAHSLRRSTNALQRAAHPAKMRSHPLRGQVS